ncbi:MAG TPA: hypothetical protein VK680_04595 [Solirubrobacteraceae bacterium]|jgi:hypothetical protein|nr:hypothetical protein [Solirubrobacteraceae bacterium]
MYHLELRHFPHSAWRFNLSEQDLAAIVQPWVREQVVDMGERKWSPHLAKLTILEGPKLDVTELSMGRGWRSAQRRSEDVTQQVLDAAKQAMQGAVAAGMPAVAPAAGARAPAVPEAARPAAAVPEAAAPAADAPTIAAALSDPVALGVQLAALLGPDPMALLEAWRVAAAGSPGLAPSDSLALAERAMRRASGELA